MKELLSVCLIYSWNIWVYSKKTFLHGGHRHIHLWPQLRLTSKPKWTFEIIILMILSLTYIYAEELIFTSFQTYWSEGSTKCGWHWNLHLGISQGMGWNKIFLQRTHLDSALLGVGSFLTLLIQPFPNQQ